MAQGKLKNQHPLAAADVTSDAEALLILPKGYIDLRVPNKSVSNVPTNDDQARLYMAELVSKQGFDSDDNLTHSLKPVKLKLEFKFESKFERSNLVLATVFGATFAWNGIEVGDFVQFTGKLVTDRDGLSIRSIALARATGKVHAVYAGVTGQLAGAVIEPLVQMKIQDQDSLEEMAARIRANRVIVNVLKDCGYKAGIDFLNDLHRPNDLHDGEWALRAARTACVRDIQYQGRCTSNDLGDCTDVTQELVARVKAQPEALSYGQRQALNVIRLEIAKKSAARVLLNGDVGSGKTLVFLLAAAAVATAGSRAVILVPSELVARQIFKQALARFPDLNPMLFIGTDKVEPTADNKLIVGTTALLSLQLDEVGLIVVDEQHKFSVDQRQKFVTNKTHVIEASATPIPRSLALALFDGWVEAKIVGSPFEKKIYSRILTPEMAFHAKQSIHMGLDKGMKTLMVYPSVSGGEKSAVEAFKRLSEVHPGKIALAHGRLKSEDKEAALESFRDGTCPILVATTVIEVGVDVPDITTFVVHESQTFGVSQLHQMRGRLVRNGGIGNFFMMVKETASKDTLQRLEAVRDNLDGFALAERDMELRGFGNVLGEAQSGGTSTFFKLARLEARDFLDEKKPLKYKDFQG